MNPRFQHVSTAISQRSAEVAFQELSRESEKPLMYSAPKKMCPVVSTAPETSSVATWDRPLKWAMLKTCNDHRWSLVTHDILMYTVYSYVYIYICMYIYIICINYPLISHVSWLRTKWSRQLVPPRGHLECCLSTSLTDASGKPGEENGFAEVDITRGHYLINGGFP